MFYINVLRSEVQLRADRANRKVLSGLCLFFFPAEHLGGQTEHPHFVPLIFGYPASLLSGKGWGLCDALVSGGVHPISRSVAFCLYKAILPCKAVCSRTPVMTLEDAVLPPQSWVYHLACAVHGLGVFVCFCFCVFFFPLVFVF